MPRLSSRLSLTLLFRSRNHPALTGSGNPIAIPQASAVATHDKLRSGHYVQALHHFDAKLKTIRARLSHHDLSGLEEEMAQLRATLEQYLDQFEQLKSTYFLQAADFHQLLKLEEYLISTLSPQVPLVILSCDPSCLTFADLACLVRD